MQPFTPNHLIALAAVGRTGSLTAASAALGKTQPAVSAHLKQLADAVGMPLVTRHRYGVTLTPAGESLLSYAEACLRAMEGAQQTIARLQGFEEGTLRVLASPSVAVYVLPAALAAFRMRHPQIELAVTRHRADDAIRALESGAGDVALVRGVPSFAAGRAANFTVRALVEDETVLAVKPDHPLARARTLAPRALDRLGIVAREPGSATRALIERRAAEAGIAFDVKFEAAGVEALKEAVLQGFGAGFISRLVIRREIAAGLLVGILVPDFELSRPVTLVYPAQGLSVPAVPRFVETLETAYPK
jgi:DNA-binding transcriptional LysR family regulator